MGLLSMLQWSHQEILKHPQSSIFSTDHPIKLMFHNPKLLQRFVISFPVFGIWDVLISTQP